MCRCICQQGSDFYYQAWYMYPVCDYEGVVIHQRQETGHTMVKTGYKKTPWKSCHLAKNYSSPSDRPKNPAPKYIAKFCSFLTVQVQQNPLYSEAVRRCVQRCQLRHRTGHHLPWLSRGVYRRKRGNDLYTKIIYFGNLLIRQLTSLIITE